MHNVLRHGNTFHTLREISSGTRGTKETLKEMANIVRRWRVHPRIRTLAVRLVSSCPDKHWRCEVHKLHEYVRDRIRFVGDVNGVETLQTPELTLQLRAGDCDDQSILLASLLESIEHPARFVAVGFGSGEPFAHVFVETRIGAYWVACETTEQWALGQRPRGIRRTMVQNV